jgi:hypothetical protein
MPIQVFAFRLVMLMDKKTKQQLFVWNQLYRQCEQLEMKLDELHVHARLVLARGHRQNGAIKPGSDTGAVEAEVMELRNRTDAAFKEALQLLKRADLATRPS